LPIARIPATDIAIDRALCDIGHTVDALVDHVTFTTADITLLKGTDIPDAASLDIIEHPTGFTFCTGTVIGTV
jgi:hypothetical protein